MCPEARSFPEFSPKTVVHFSHSSHTHADSPKAVVITRLCIDGYKNQLYYLLPVVTRLDHWTDYEPSELPTEQDRDHIIPL